MGNLEEPGEVGDPWGLRKNESNGRIWEKFPLIPTFYHLFPEFPTGEKTLGEIGATGKMI